MVINIAIDDERNVVAMPITLNGEPDQNEWEIMGVI